MIIPALNRLRQVVDDPRIAQEIQLAFEQICSYYDGKIKELSDKLKESSRKISGIESSPLFSGALATPLIDATGNELATAGIDRALSPSDIPNLDASKVNSGTFNLPRLDIKILKTDDGLSEDISTAPNVNIGKVRIKDNSGNSIYLMSCA